MNINSTCTVNSEVYLVTTHVVPVPKRNAIANDMTRVWGYKFLKKSWFNLLKIYLFVYILFYI